MPAARNCAASAPPRFGNRVAALCARRGAGLGAPSSRGLFGREQRRLMFGDQRVDDFAQRFAFENLRQLVERQIDAVVRHAALRKIVGADALGAVAGADLAAAFGGARGILLLPLRGRRAASAARPSPWRGCDAASDPPARHHDAGRKMRYPHGGFGLVDVLAAGAARAQRVDLESASLMATSRSSASGSTATVAVDV